MMRQHFSRTPCLRLTRRVGVATLLIAVTLGYPVALRAESRLPGPPSPPCPPGAPGDQRCKDADTDGFFRQNPAGVCPGLTDCNDDNAAVWPGAPEGCDGVANACGGMVDAVSCGVGACRRTSNVCETSTCQPGILALESCTDGIDNNCNGVIDEGVPVEPSVVSVLRALFSIVGTGDIGVPASCGGSTTVCCPGNVPMADCGPFRIALTEAPVVSAVSDPNRFPFTLRMRIQTVQDIPMQISGIACDVRIDSASGSVPYVELRSEMLFNLPVTPEAPISLGFGGMTLENLEADDIALTGGFLCQMAGFGIGVFTDTIASTLEDILRDHAQNHLCEP